MNEESLFFSRVSSLCKGQVFSCSTGESITEVARIMQQKNISGVIVIDSGFPVGVITDRDYRNKVIAAGKNPCGVSAGDIMARPVITVRQDDYIFEAIYRMSRNNIHRLAVVDEMGKVVGVVTDTDIIKMQTNTPLYFIRDLEYAGNLEEIKKLNNSLTDFVRYLVTAGIRTKDLVNLISYLNDSIILKVINVITRESYAGFPRDFAFLVLGSEGRMEQTLKTDQDNAIVYDDSLGQEDVKLIEKLSRELIDALIYIGVPECKGGIMAKNLLWRRSLVEWEGLLKEWISKPTPENILNFSMFSDLRSIFGNMNLEKKLKEYVRSHIAETPVFLALMAKNAVNFEPPVGMFNPFKVEKSGDYRGRLDIKKGGIFPLTEGVKILAYEAGIMNGGTRDKIEQLIKRDVMPEDDLLEVETSFNFFLQIRLRNQLEDMARGLEPSNYINPSKLNHIEKERLRIGFSVVKALQTLLRSKFRLDFIS